MTFFLTSNNILSKYNIEIIWMQTFSHKLISLGIHYLRMSVCISVYVKSVDSD